MAKAPGPIQQARSIVQPQYASVDYASRKAAQRSSAEQRALTASGKALVNLLQQGVGPAGQMYDQAVGQQQALAQGAAQLLAQQNPNAQIQGDLAQINAPPEQQAQLAHSLQAQFPGQGAVLNVQQGAIPGASLVAQKAAQQGYLAGLPTLAALSGQQSLRGLLAKAADQQQALQAQRLQISGQIPTLALGIANTAAQRQAAAASARAEAAYRQAELDARAQSQNDLNAYRQNEFSQRNASQASLDRYRQGLVNSRNNKGRGGTSGYQLKTLKDGSTVVFNPNTGTWQKASGALGNKTGGASGATTKATPNEVQKYADTAYYGVQPKQQSILQANGTRKVVNVGGVPAIGYQKALFRLMHTFGLPLTAAQGVLNDYYAPGERGRPLVDFQQRQARHVTDTGRPQPKKRGRG